MSCTTPLSSFVVRYSRTIKRILSWSCGQSCLLNVNHGHRSESCLHQNAYREDKSENVDIIICGGGIVGMAMACALGNESALSDKRILLLESARKPPTFDSTAPYGIRVSALSKGSIDFLKGLNVWQIVEKLRISPVKQMQVWDSCSDSRITFNHPDLQDELAFIVENNLITYALSQTLADLTPNVTVLYEVTATTFDLPTGQSQSASIYLSDDRCIKTKLLIGSDGFNSGVRKAAGFHVLGWKYRQSAVVAALNITQVDNTVAWQRFLPSGPIALLPLTDTLSSLVWSTSESEADNLLEMEEENFIDAINDAFWHERHRNNFVVQAGDVYNNIMAMFSNESLYARQLPPTVQSVAPSGRAKYPLAFSHSSHYISKRVALIGDAAHRAHPLAGQGLNLGFGDVSELSRVITDAALNGADIGSTSYLSRYETARQRRNVPVMFSLDMLQKLYSTHFTPVVFARSLGLQTVNNVPLLKRFIIEQAARL